MEIHPLSHIWYQQQLINDRLVFLHLLKPVKVKIIYEGDRVVETQTIYETTPSIEQEEKMLNESYNLLQEKVNKFFKAEEESKNIRTQPITDKSFKW